MNRLLGFVLLLVITPLCHAQSEIVLDNATAAFSTTGTWPASTAVTGFVGSNYQTHEANGPSPAAISVDNTDAGFSVTGTWPVSTAVSGYLGANYQVHAANGEPVGSIVADNSSGSATGTWPTSTSVSGYIGTNYQTHTPGTGANVFTWTLNVPVAGSYPVYARWTSHPNRASNAKYTVNHAAGSTVVTVNMEQGSGQWNLLGNFSFDAGAATVSLSDDANEYVIADAVMIVPPGAGPNTATWTLNVPAGGSYQVYARWTAHPNRATDAKYTVNHAAGSTVATVNQEAGGGTWSLLGTFDFNAGAATVTLTDQANGYVIADAVMIAPPGAAPNTATWTPNVAQAGTYELFARWTQHANRATNAVYAVTHGAGSTNVTVNQQANGGAWNSLGTFALNPGTAHKVTLTDQANGFVIADAIRLVPVTLQPLTSLYFIQTDHLNTPRAIYDSAQQVRWKWDQQEPFGVNVPDENPAGQGAFEFPGRFPGQYSDKETGLSYNYFRDYDSGLGRYTRSDPVGLGAGLNTYAYVTSGPLSKIDIYGLAGATTHGVRRCLPSDDCPTLSEKIKKLIASIDERRTEMAAYGPQPYSSYAGHAMQIVQQVRSLRRCQAYYENHEPPCCAQGQKAPDTNPFPLPQWQEPAVPSPEPTPSPAPTPPNQNSNAAAAAGTAAAVVIIYMMITGKP